MTTPRIGRLSCGIITSYQIGTKLLSLIRRSFETCRRVCKRETKRGVQAPQTTRLRDGHDLPLRVLDNDKIGRDDLSSIHEDDRGLIERVGTNAAALHEGAVGGEGAAVSGYSSRELPSGTRHSPAKDDGEVGILHEHDLLLDRLFANLRVEDRESKFSESTEPSWACSRSP